LTALRAIAGFAQLHVKFLLDLDMTILFIKLKYTELLICTFYSSNTCLSKNLNFKIAKNN